jgi:hypothetical protein
MPETAAAFGRSSAMFIRALQTGSGGVFHCSSCRIELDREEKLVGVTGGAAHDIYRCPRHQIIPSLKAISEEGRFEITNLLRERKQLPHYTVRVLIGEDLRPGSVHPPSLASAA